MTGTRRSAEQVRPQQGDCGAEGHAVGRGQEGRSRAWCAMTGEEGEIADVSRGEGGHAREEGRVRVRQQQDVTAPAAQERRDEEARCAPGGRPGGEQRHQEGLGDGVAAVEADGQGGEVDGGGEGEGGEEGERGAVGEVTAARTVAADGVRGSHAGTVSSAVSGAGAGPQPGPRKTRPARSRQLRAFLMSLMIATYSWVATLIGLNVLMFLVNP